MILATILKGLLQAVEYFQKVDAIHRDIKAGNILLSADGMLPCCLIFSLLYSILIITIVTIFTMRYELYYHYIIIITTGIYICSTPPLLLFPSL